MNETTPAVEPRKPLTHALKTWPEYFQAVATGGKSFEVREHDRDFRRGDTLLLREWCPVKRLYTGREVRRDVGYVLEGGNFGMSPRVCVMGLNLPESEVLLALRELVMLKDMKDRDGKTPVYEASRAVAWDRARAALVAYDEGVKA